MAGLKLLFILLAITSILNVKVAFMIALGSSEHTNFSRLYDLNGDGTITKSEMANVVVAVYELLGIECATLVIVNC